MYFFLARYRFKLVQLKNSTGCKTRKLSSSSHKHTLRKEAWRTFHLLGKLSHFLKNGGNRPTPLPASCERNNAVAAHVVAASHDRPAGKNRTQ